MVVCRGSYERGFAAAVVYESVFVSLADIQHIRDATAKANIELHCNHNNNNNSNTTTTFVPSRLKFCNIRSTTATTTAATATATDADGDAVDDAVVGEVELLCEGLDVDGLPLVGQRLCYGDPLYCITDMNSTTTTTTTAT